MSGVNLNILIGGPAGAGVEKTGRNLTLSFVRAGYYVFANVEHMSQIRGGNNFLRVRISDEPVGCHEEKVDVIIALDKRTVEEHIGEVVDGGAVIFDEGIGIASSDVAGRGGVTMIALPLKKIAEELGNPLVANVVALGCAFGLLDFDISELKNILVKTFAKKSAEVQQMNVKAAEKGYELAGDYTDGFAMKLEPREGAGKMFLMGNDAVSLGALKAGCKFVGEYPMTPSSSILHFMAKWAKDYGVVVKHVEDEIAAVGSIIGAGYAGVRALAATSGGGFALMSEGIGLASMNEVPIVIVNVMRPGPATGQPTRSAAGDLRQVIHAGQDDPVKIVLCPGDISECFYMGYEAFNYAERYQIPVIIAYDKNLGEGFFAVEPFDESGLKVDRGRIATESELGDNYLRYLRTEDGVSPRAIPGMRGGVHTATSDEHNEKGEIFEDADNRKLMMEKRMKKMEVALAELPKPEVIGEKDAEITFVTWNSAKLACIDAIELLKKEGKTTNVLQIKTAYPFHKEEVAELLKGAKRLIAVEGNYTGQMAGLIAEHTGILINERILRYDGRPMTGKFIIDNLNG